MIKSFIVSTREVDEIETAVNEIISALEPEKNLLKNSLGIISCYSEFEETGVLKAVCDALPFDCIGATTALVSACKQTEQIILTVAVLTSDDCGFGTVSLHIDENYNETIALALNPLFECPGEGPALMLGYFPLTTGVSGDLVINAIDRASGGVPLFGTAATIHNTDYPNAKTILNGEAKTKTVVLGLIYGPVNYSFGIASLDDSITRKLSAVITGSEDNVLTEINNQNFLEYFLELGLPRAIFSLETLPLIIDTKDSTVPVVRVVISLTPEGHAVCAGAMPQGAGLSIGRVDADDIISTTESAIRPLIENACTILSYSCISRYWALGAQNMAEAGKVGEMCGDVNYLFACSGGEICPLPGANGKTVNIYHNYTNAICKLW